MMTKLLNLQLFTTGFVAPGAGNTHLSSTFGRLLEPGLRKIFFQGYDELKEQFTSIYNIDSSTKAKETDYGMGAFGDWTVRASDYDNVTYNKLSSGLDRTYVHSAFTQGFMVTRELFDDDQYRQIEKMPLSMARSGRAKVEKDAVTTLLNGHAGANIYDGVKLFSLSHPLLDSAALGKNTMTGALSDVTLKTAIQMMHEIPDEAGNLAQFRPTKLIVPPALLDTAIRITNSDKISGTANNDTNKYLNSFGLEIVPLDYLGAAAGGSDVKWFLQDGLRHQMNFFWRVRPEFKWAEDFDSFVAKYRGYMRYSYGVSDWRGIIGSTGV